MEEPFTEETANMEGEDSVESLKARIRDLELQVRQMEELGTALAEAQEDHQRASQSMMHMKETLTGALKSNRRQLEEIAKAHEKFLPLNFPVLGGIEVSAHCRPCADVGGDFYDVFELFDGRVAICMADVAGHGAIASISMATSRAILRTALLEAEPFHSPSDIMERLYFWLRHQFDIEQFVTMWLGIYDPETGKLSACSAAHPKAVYWPKEKDLEYLAIDPGLPLGLAGIDPIPYPEVTVNFNVGDRMILYTDGWNETPTREGNCLTDSEFLDLCGHAYGQPVKHVPQVMFMQFERHAANSKIRDDISLLVFDRVS